jgi:hypothetical protein
MILEPIGQGAPPPSPQPAAASTATVPTTAAVHLDQAKLDQLRQRWKETVQLSAGPLRKAAEEHYAIIRDLQSEQQRLISEADRVARLIDELQRQYNELTTPRPAPER